MNGRWVEFGDRRQHHVTGPVGKGLQPAYAACGLVDVVKGDEKPGMLPAVCVRCKAKLLQGASHG